MLGKKMDHKYDTEDAKSCFESGHVKADNWIHKIRQARREIEYIHPDRRGSCTKHLNVDFDEGRKQDDKKRGKIEAFNDALFHYFSTTRNYEQMPYQIVGYMPQRIEAVEGVPFPKVHLLVWLKDEGGPRKAISWTESPLKYLLHSLVREEDDVCYEINGVGFAFITSNCE
jgi:hypothetical protein